MPKLDPAVALIRGVLSAAGARPEAAGGTEAKNPYAIRFAEEMATRLASDLSPKLKGISATTARTARSVRGAKQLDVNFSTPQHGLALGISLKSVHTRDPKSGRYTHNMKRNEEELRIEASGYHKRQPYAVMVGVLFLPFDSCDDGRKQNSSSFGSFVRHLRPYAGRVIPDNEIDRFEKLFIGLYELDGSDMRFFDVEADPPKNRRPASDGALLAADGRARRLFTYPEFLDAIYHEYLRRNSAEFRWVDGEEDPLKPDELHEGSEDEEA